MNVKNIVREGTQKIQCEDERNGYSVVNDELWGIIKDLREWLNVKNNSVRVRVKDYT